MEREVFARLELLLARRRVLDGVVEALDFPEWNALDRRVEVIEEEIAQLGRASSSETLLRAVRCDFARVAEDVRVLRGRSDAETRLKVLEHWYSLLRDEPGFRGTAQYVLGLGRVVDHTLRLSGSIARRRARMLDRR